MILPLRRDALRDRAALDEADEADAYEHTTPSQRILRCLELSELARELAHAVDSAFTPQPSADIEEKARLYVAPMRAAVR